MPKLVPSVDTDLAGRVDDRPRTEPRPQPTWTTTDRKLGRWACYLTVVLSVAYVPVMGVGFLANGGFADPVGDPYLATMELLILLMSVPLVLLFAAVHSYAPTSRKIVSRSSLAFVTVAVGITTCVHIVLLTVGRQTDQTSLPGYDQLLSWTWPSVVFGLDIAAWDFFFGIALILAALVFSGPGLPALVRRGLLLSGSLCLLGLVGAPLGDMGLRDIGIVGYAVVFPVVLLFLARLFAATPVAGGDA
jgi:hypothetical protein